MIWAGHGAGIRSHGRYPGRDAFDLFLLPGRTKLDRLSELGLVDRSRSTIIGYPKFDFAPELSASRKLFDNPRPVVLYNPHFNRDESSWAAWGEQILDYFVGHPEFNLVFAPHILLFGRGRSRLPRRYFTAPNIRVDLDSPALTDMTYTALADIYLGDVSSQAYEFAGFRPRPRLFLNPHHRSWRSDGNLPMWRIRPVIDHLGDLGVALKSACPELPSYLPLQAALTRDTFDRGQLSAGERGAQAIAGLLER